MPRRMSATQVGASIDTLLDDVADGDEVEITKHGRVVARLTPATSPHALKDRFSGVAASAADDEALFSTGVDWNLE